MLKSTSLQVYIQKFRFSVIISFLNSNLTIMGYNENATSFGTFFYMEHFSQKMFFKIFNRSKNFGVLCILHYIILYYIYMNVFKLIVKFSKTFCSIIMLKHLKHNYFDNITKLFSNVSISGLIFIYFSKKIFFPKSSFIY